MKKKQYSSKEKVKYHENRVRENDAGDNKRFYSMNWLQGFNDPAFKHNLSAAESEIRARKRNHAPFNEYDIGLRAYRNGLAERCKVGGKKK